MSKGFQIDVPVDKIIFDYKKRIDMDTLALKYNVSRPTIRDRLSKSGVKIRQHGEWINKELPMSCIRDKYLLGKNSVELGLEYSVSSSTIGRKLKQLGVKMRNISEAQRFNLPIEQIKEKYLAGKTITELSKEFKVSKSLIWYRLKEERIRCRGHWKGGVSFEPYGLNFNRLLKNQIKERDNHQCQYCGCHKILDIHHIDYNKKNNNEWNLIALCKVCHIRTNHDHKFWMEYYQKLMGAKTNNDKNKLLSYS